MVHSIIPMIEYFDLVTKVRNKKKTHRLKAKKKTKLTKAQTRKMRSNNCAHKQMLTVTNAHIKKCVQ